MMKKLSVGKIIDATWTYALLLIVAFIFFFPCQQMTETRY